MQTILGSKRALVVTAHPDDEAFLAAGTIRQITGNGGAVSLLCATRGERGRAWTDLPGEALAQVREQELREAAQAVGVRNVKVLGLGDGQLPDQRELLATAVEQAIAVLHPDVLITFGSDGYTGHADHCAMHQVVREVIFRLGVPCAYFAYPPDPWGAEVRSILARKRVHGAYETMVPHSGRSEVVVIDPALKLAALQLHQTQFLGLDPHRLFSPACAEHFLSHEYFVWDE